MLVQFPEPHDPAAACALSAFDRCAGDLECADALARDPRRLLGDCFEGAGAANDLADAVEWWRCDAGVAQKHHATVAPAAGVVPLAFMGAQVSKVAVWVGPYATDGSFSLTNPTSAFGMVYAGLPRLEVAHEECAAELRARKKDVWCHPFAFAAAGEAALGGASEREKRIATQGCAPTLHIPAAHRARNDTTISSEPRISPRSRSFRLVPLLPRSPDVWGRSRTSYPRSLWTMVNVS